MKTIFLNIVKVALVSVVFFLYSTGASAQEGGADKHELILPEIPAGSDGKPLFEMPDMTGVCITNPAKAKAFVPESPDRIPEGITYPSQPVTPPGQDNPARPVMSADALADPLPGVPEEPVYKEQDLQPAQLPEPGPVYQPPSSFIENKKPAKRIENVAQAEVSVPLDGAAKKKTVEGAEQVELEDDK